MREADYRFQTTDWSQIRKARTQDLERQRLVIGALMSRYWQPVYCYLLAHGHDQATAEDLAQGSFYEIVWEKELIQRARKEKGKFRTFLLTALDNYVENIRRHGKARKRRPKGNLVSLDAMEGLACVLPADQMTPEDAFMYGWITSLIDEVLSEVRNGCIRDGKEVHWRLFQARVLEPIMSGNCPPPLGVLCKTLGLENTENRPSNMIVTVERRFARSLMAHLEHHLEPGSDIEDERRELFRFLSERCARSDK